jgi:hypothetical protein
MDLISNSLGETFCFHHYGVFIGNIEIAVELLAQTRMSRVGYRLTRVQIGRIGLQATVSLPLATQYSQYIVLLVLVRAQIVLGLLYVPT